MAEFTNRRGDEWLTWMKNSNYIVILAVPDEEALLSYARRVGDWDGILVTEPDIGDEATALAIVPGEHWKMLSDLPLALNVKERVMV